MLKLKNFKDQKNYKKSQKQIILIKQRRLKKKINFKNN